MLHSHNRLPLTLAILGLLAAAGPGMDILVGAVTIQEVMWNMPNGRAPNFSQTFATGQTIPVSWNPYNGTMVDLWLTTYDYNEITFDLLLTTRIDLSQRRSDFMWTIDQIPVSILQRTAKFVLRFKPTQVIQPAHGGGKDAPVFKPDEPELSSPGFLIVQGVSPTSSTSSASPPAATSSTASPSGTAPGQSTAGAAGSGPAQQQQQPLPAGTVAGISVGAAAGLASVGALVWYLCLRRRASRGGRAHHPVSTDMEGSGRALAAPAVAAVACEAGEHEKPAVFMGSDGTKYAELSDASEPQHAYRYVVGPAELSGS